MASFKFCLDCNNMLYPQADNESKQLLYSCRNCPYSERADNPLVYHHRLESDLSETAGVTNDIGSDPTLPRSNKECPKCHNKECVFFQSQQRRAITSMVPFYVCLNCHHTFRPTDRDPL